MSTLAAFIQYGFGIPSYENQRRKKIKGIPTGKEDMKILKTLPESY